MTQQRHATLHEVPAPKSLCYFILEKDVIGKVRMSMVHYISGNYNVAKVLNKLVPCCSCHLILSGLMGFACDLQMILITPIHWRTAKRYLSLYKPDTNRNQTKLADSYI